MLFFVGQCAGKDLGTFGETFTIHEDNLATFIMQRLQRLHEKGDLETHQRTLQNRITAQVRHPKPVEGMATTTKPRTYTFDPSIVVSKDLEDHNGQVFYTKGTRVNPLQVRSLSKPLVFIDGDDEAQVLWLALHSTALIILVKGDPFALMKTLNTPVFYDQGGAFTTKLGIRQVPAKVIQMGDVLQIFEELAHAP